MAHSALFSHIKLRLLCQDLGIPKPHAVGYLEFLTHYVCTHHIDGDLSTLNDAEIEMAAEWEGEPGAFLRAAIARRFIDRDDEGTRIHDWIDWCPDWVKKRLVRLCKCTVEELPARLAERRRTAPDGQQRRRTAPNGADDTTADADGAARTTPAPGGAEQRRKGNNGAGRRQAAPVAPNGAQEEEKKTKERRAFPAPHTPEYIREFESLLTDRGVSEDAAATAVGRVATLGVPLDRVSETLTRAPPRVTVDKLTGYLIRELENGRHGSG